MTMDISTANPAEMSEDELRQLIQEAEKELSDRLSRRTRQTLKEARRLAAEVGFDVSFTKAVESEGKKRGKGAVTRGKAVQKYRNPENPEETWSGRGRPPKWVQAALAGGRTMADLQIEAAG
jgi:DNA-binding protein H-NS